MMLTLMQTFNQPISGYWDGGPRREFCWRIDGTPRQDTKGQFVRVGSWAANHWCHVACGKTDKQTLGNLRRRLSMRAKRAGRTCTFEYRE